MEEALIKRILPHSIEAEQSVVVSMMIDDEAINKASEFITGDDFYQSAYGILFDAIVELQNAGKPADLITVQNFLKEKGVQDEISSLEFLKNIVNDVPTSANVQSYARIVAEKSQARKMIRLSEEIAAKGYAGNEPLEELLEYAEKRTFEVVQKNKTSGFVSIRDAVVEALNQIEKASRNRNAITGIPTGFTELDLMTAGMQPSDLILVAASPSMGKTAFVLNIARHMTIKENRAVAIFSLEMSRTQLVNRLLAMESYIDAQRIRTGSMNEAEWGQLVNGASVIGKSKLVIDDAANITISDLRSKCRKYKSEFGIEAIIIDYLQLMSGRAGGKSENRQQEITEICRSLKGIARELNVPVIVLSQLSREVEKREEKRPILSDLRESGAIEQDADLVMFIYRREYYFPEEEESKGKAEIILAKQRNGRTGSIDLAWISKYTKFADLDYSQRKRSQGSVEDSQQEEQEQEENMYV